MNYIELINRFWKIHQEVEFRPNEVYLYFYLLDACNSRGWQNPFEYPNRKIVLATGMSEKTVIEVRNRLQQKGLIEFESGKRNAKSPVYYLLEESKTVSKKVSKKESKKVSKKVNLNINKKQETITPTPPKGEGINYRARLLFEEHFKETFGNSYYWTQKDAGSMTQIIKKLKFLRNDKNLPNDDENVLQALKVFLGTIKDGWIFENFSVPNINSKFNEIVSNAKMSNAKKVNSYGKDKYQRKVDASEDRKRESVAAIAKLREQAANRRKELESITTD